MPAGYPSVASNMGNLQVRYLVGDVNLLCSSIGGRLGPYPILMFPSYSHPTYINPSSFVVDRDVVDLFLQFGSHCLNLFTHFFLFLCLSLYIFSISV